MDPRANRRLIARLAALALVVAVVGCGTESEPVPPGLDDAPSQTFYDYTTRQTRDAVVEWELFGSVAEQYDDDTTMHLTGVRMIFYEEGEQSAVLTSETGEIDRESQATVARGNVVVVTEDDRRLESEILYWDPARDLIHTDQFFTFTDGDQVMTGVGLESDPELANVNVLEDVEGTIRDRSDTSDPRGR